MAYPKRRLTQTKRRKRKRSTVRRSGAIGGARGGGGVWSDVGTLLGAGLGAPFGGFAGAGFGGTLGLATGGLIDHLSGSGAYDVRVNSIVNGHLLDEGTQIPAFGDMSHGTIIRHREFITDVNTANTTAFNLTSYSVNPGLATTFPWLSGVASNYDQYQILGMVFEYKTTFSDITSGGAMGTVIIASDYDTADASYTSKLEMENSQYCVSVKPSCSTIHVIECDPKASFSPMKYIRAEAVPAGKDVRLYDHVNVQLATVGIPQTAGNIGELWVTYEIALYKPQLIQSDSLGSGGVVDHIQIPSSATSSHYLGSTTTAINLPVSGSNIGGRAVNSTYYFPVGLESGNYMLLFSWNGAGTSLSQYVTYSLSNCTALNYQYNDSSATIGQGAVTNAVQWLVVTVQVTATNASVTITAGTLPGSLASGDLWVWGLPSQIAS